MQDDKNRKIKIKIDKVIVFEKDYFEEDTTSFSSNDLIEWGEAYLENHSQLKKLIDDFGFNVSIDISD